MPFRTLICRRRRTLEATLWLNATVPFEGRMGVLGGDNRSIDRRFGGLVVAALFERPRLEAENDVVQEDIVEGGRSGTVALTDPSPIPTEMTVRDEATDSTL